MNKIWLLLRENRAVTAMFLFTVLFYGVLIAARPQTAAMEGSAGERAQTMAEAKNDFARLEENFKKNIVGQPVLINTLSLGMLLFFVVGIFIDFRWLGRALKEGTFLPISRAPAAVGWGLRELFLVVLFLFFSEAVLLLTETLLFAFLGQSNPHDDLMLMINSLLRNASAAVFVIWLVTRVKGGSLLDLGLTRQRLLYHVGEGVAGYMAALPVLAACLVAVALALQGFGYEPPPQNVVQIYLKKSSDPYLLYFTFFVAGIGPIIEEVFFRGFAYNALKTRFGIRSGMIWTSLLFAAFHVNLAAFVPIFVISLFLCYLYEKTGSLVPSMTMHVCHNLLMVSLTMIFRSVAG